jgi:hypothetical protein
VSLDGAAVNLDLTPDARNVALCYLGHLVRMRGDWISGPEIDAAERQKPGEGLAGQRWERVKRRLPQCLASLVQASPRKGYRLLPEALV